MDALAIVFVIFSVGLWMFIPWTKPKATHFEKLLWLTKLLSFFAFVIILVKHTTPYNENIDPFIDFCYSPISYKNASLLIGFHILSIVSLIVLYIKELKLPPTLIVFCVFAITVGILINISFLFHVSQHDLSQIDLWNRGKDATFFLSLYPCIQIIISMVLLIKLIRNKAQLNSKVHYKNKWLHWINNKLVASKNLPVLSIFLTIPFLIIMLIILTLFGQDIDSLTKVYTETATWRLSEHIHPPTVDDRHGHYLCTVAAHGDPKIVKPIGVGKRNNKLIIINRQLQISNAFEYMIERISPKLHCVIRKNYDTHGINLAKRINNVALSNLTYILMKPFEWLFLISLYTYFVEPEKVIKRQYATTLN